MKILKKIVSAVLLLAVLLTAVLLSAGGSSGQTLEGEIFSDVDSGDTYADAVLYLKDNDVVDGYPDGSFQPYKTINRAEFLKIAMRASAPQNEPDNYEVQCFTDVNSVSDWFGPDVCLAKALGLVDGYDDGSFRPTEPVNFAEAAKMTVNAMNVATTESDDEIWYRPYVNVLSEVNAIPESIYGFDKEMTRGEMAEMVYRVDDEITYLDSASFIEIKMNGIATAAGGEMVPFESCTDLQTYLQESSESYGYMEEEMTGATADDGDVAPVSPSKSADYSETNVQVVGVDEADIVKTDGEYIYLVSQDNVRVVKAYPPSQMAEVDSLSFVDNFNPSELFVDGDRLIVLGTNYGRVDYWIETDESYPITYNSTLTEVYIYDISDKSNVEEIRHLSFEGYYHTSRKVDDTLYLVANKSVYHYYDEPIPLDDVTPYYSDSATKMAEPLVGCNDIMYVPYVDSTNYLTVAAIPVTDPSADISEEVILGASGNVYASTENLYVAEYDYGYYWEENASEGTVIHRFALNPGEVSYTGKGNVDGSILNQFSMDESDGYFRIATTKGNVWSGNSTSNVFVLNDDLEVTGSVTGIAPGERIYSARFMGDRLYMVTFKKVDPLFVIDLSDPQDPEILGKLKIPGYSDYLHPYDENHIIGFGKDAIDASEEEIAGRDLDFAWYQGLKIAMFDVTDPENPIEMHKVIIGDRGTDSELLYDHKALLFDKAKGIFAFPVTLAEIPEEVKNDPSTPDNTYGDYVFQGAYIYDVSLEDGFDLRGTITHYDDNEVAEKSGYYWSGIKDIDRILYIGDYFYTTAISMIRASEMDSLDSVESVEFEGVTEEEDYYWY